MRGDWYQASLIFLGVLVTAMFSVFFYRELFPEYETYQNIYIELENFRSIYNGQPPPPFVKEVKQILMEIPGGAPPEIDRCTSCHVALDFPHFSPTRIAKDINGETVLNDKGIPVQEPNPDYIWAHVDAKIAELEKAGEKRQADHLRALKTVTVGGHVYDVTKVLRAHPLIGRETRPFEYHPLEQNGCTSCHSGNGRGLVTDRAHGPMYDGEYEVEYTGPEPQFLESDPEHDPPFAHVFNHKPSDRLLFQTNPLYVGALIQAKCVQCHTSSDGIFREVAREAGVVTSRRENQSKAIRSGYDGAKKAFVSYLLLKNAVASSGYESTVQSVKKLSNDYTLPGETRKAAAAQLAYLMQASAKTPKGANEEILANLDSQMQKLLGDSSLVQQAAQSINPLSPEADAAVEKFVDEKMDAPGATGTLFARKKAVEKDQNTIAFVKEADSSIESTTDNAKVLGAIKSEIDLLTKNYQAGRNFFFSQACYGCHRIDGLSRGGVGPDLTNAGGSYPWFLKESIVWPQADLKTSTMPNFRLDHSTVEDLMTFLLAQHGRGKAMSEMGYRKELIDWEAGAKLPWEKPINPGKLHDLSYSMTVFATEGCAACHRLQGFESNVGYAVQKGKPDFETLYQEREWFRALVPETIEGSQLVRVLKEHEAEIDRRIVDDVRKGSILEEIEANHPGVIETYYTPFEFAKRAIPNNPEWQNRWKRVLMIYIQEYGLGRLICPRPNWSGIYRSDEWLIEHFRKPSQHTAKSLMPTMPFDDTKFYALTYMLDVLAQRNLKQEREIWEHRGFNPRQAYLIHCAQCHGEFLQGNGPVSEWIYPIPKNLRNADFLTNYTRENIIFSITHGVKGTPMPPWGEVAQDKPMDNPHPVLNESEIKQIVDWLFSSLLGGTMIPTEMEIPKWQYKARDVIQELDSEGNVLKSGPPPQFLQLQEAEPKGSSMRAPTDKSYLAARDSKEAKSPANKVDAKVDEIFTILPNPEKGPEKNLYYVKKNYFTTENIRAGQSFFELNCSVCHGIEADGSGFRAGTMYDAKPRMLTNLHWVDSRDDLRLLRSIKYGVMGTAMTPWGDLTSSLQRLQLVIFIRSLSMEQTKRDDLFSTMYRGYDTKNQILDAARVAEYRQINANKEELRALQDKRTEVFQKIEEGQAQPAQAVELYKKELSLARQLKQHEEADHLLIELKELVHKESTIYQDLGVTLIGKTFVGDTLNKFLEMVKTDSISYAIKDGRISVSFDEKKQKEMQKMGDALVDSLNKQIASTDKEVAILEGKLSSPETESSLKQLKGEGGNFKKIRNEMVSGFKESARLRQKQLEIYNRYQKAE